MSEWAKKRYEAEMEVRKTWSEDTIEERVKRMDMKTYKRDRKSPPYSANDYPDKTYGIGVDDKVWQIGIVGSSPKRPSGYKRWNRSYHTGVDKIAIERTPSPEMVGYDDYIKRDTPYGESKRERKTMSDTELDPEMGIDSEVKLESDGEELSGLGALFGDKEGEVEATPEPIVEEEPVVHIPTVISKLKGSVSLPEEFKFADDMVFYTMLRNIYRNDPILITGPSGCGKSSLGKILADITAKPYYAFNFGDTMNPAAKLLGDTKFDKDKGTFFKESRFVGALRDSQGAFIMLDEVTRDRTGDLANILMPVLDGQKYLALDESDEADTVQINDGAFFYATANIGREYLGAAHDLDRAWKDRFTGGIYELDYLPKNKEVALLLIRVADLSEKDADRICDFAKRIRDLYKAEELNTAVSTRMSLKAASLVVDGMTLLEALKHTCLPFYPVVGGDDTERVRVIQAIQAMGDSGGYDSGDDLDEDEEY
jgi:MoxR-like ATPase